MHEFKTKEKYRVSYQHKNRGVKFDIDDYKGIPTLLEIESEKLDDLENFKDVL
jgi:adenylate cyclase class IV